MIKHLWQYDFTHAKYVCFPEPKEEEEGGLCGGCGKQVTELALQSVPMTEIPARLMQTVYPSNGTMLSAALDYLTAEGKV